MSKNSIRIDKVLQERFANTNIKIKAERSGDSLFVTISSTLTSSVIEIEDNNDWIAIRTDFYFVLEYSVGRATNRDKLRNRVLRLVIDMIEDGCDVEYVYRNEELIRTDFYVKSKKWASTLSRFGLFGHKTVKRQHYDFGV